MIYNLKKRIITYCERWRDWPIEAQQPYVSFAYMVLNPAALC
jgi:hypothetical protein